MTAALPTEDPSLALADLLAACVWGPVCDTGALAALDAGVLDAGLRRHGLLSLLADRLSTSPAAGDPMSLRLRREAGQHVALDMFREMDLRRALDALQAAGIVPLIMKGAELAYTHYARPDLRPRIDTDLMIAPATRGAADLVLRGLGYEAETAVTGEWVSSQTAYRRCIEGNVAHVVDLHWRVANPQVFASVFQYEELARTAVPIPALGAAARGLSPVHALLLACVHRVAHHYDSDCLIWLYDIHLLASRLTPVEWRNAADLAISRRVAAVVFQSLARTRERFGTTIPAHVMDSLDHAGAAREQTAAYLSSHRRHVQDVAQDLRALPTWSARMRLIREHVLPSPSYMRGVYAPDSHTPLGVLYLLRAWRGARRWLAVR